MRTAVVRSGAIVLVAVCVLTLSACVGKRDRNDSRLTVLTTFTVLQNIVAAVAGDKVRVESVTKAGAEIHGYEPTPGDLRRAADADLIIDNGLNLEAWFKQFVDRLDAEHIVASEGVTPIPISDDAGAGKPNPHAWMSPLNVQIYVDNIEAALSELDPEHDREYRKNADTYKAELQQVHDRMVAELAAIPQQRRALVTCEGAFSYLTRDTGMSEKFIWPVNAEQQGTSRQLQSTIDFVRANNIRAVFCESTVSDAVMRQVERATDAVFGGTLYVDSLSESDGPVPTYLDLIRHDSDTIVKALTEGGTQ
ncbi:ABC-type Zn uptake system ZnuABC Zn-binding protein ZnuA [Williamsia limnetica]|uniref:ABC-type Zn uptake system ZnuABC Zn-binding protein ZnuA n=1 Tax=Williamsia limnetica TaxID=882452 RepID=A0A318RX57_WILLI|nr:metal ABC transporter substrate-binding protein [Williamsia limnetica]PYE18013.1 ABC-type Zn uptake system ZnuABC Zn-binding protein ZnuA [Williamsia limnetica]